MERLEKICFVVAALVVAFIAGCSTKEKLPEPAPVILLDNPSLSYTVKVGRTLLINPEYENVEGASFQWVMNGKTISIQRSLSFSGTETGIYYVTLTVATKAGSTSLEMKITVAELVPPKIVGLPYQITLVQGQNYTFQPIIQNAEEASFVWYLDGVQVSDKKDYTVDVASVSSGSHTFKLVAKNEDGSDEASVKATVVDSSADAAVEWFFEKDVFNFACNRANKYVRMYHNISSEGSLLWYLDGVLVKENTDAVYPYYNCILSEPGTHSLEVVFRNSGKEASKNLTINICPAEGTYFRSGGASALCNKVYEYLPAPGQFINDGFTASTMEEACTYALNRLKANTYVSLGAWGGYIVVGFDHSILNDGGYNIAVTGNAFHNSSEPGIVWVMQDENGNGLPDDTWFQLKGSNSPSGTAGFSPCAITYYKPRTDKVPVYWTNLYPESNGYGAQGVIDYLPEYHSQSSYYPAWVKTESYTLVGEALPSRTQEVGPGSWINGDWDWGYADNYSTIDMVKTGGTDGSPADNRFRISDAVDVFGAKVDLKYIDFVKIQTGTMAKAGWIGEVSTEVFAVKDYNMLK